MEADVVLDASGRLVIPGGIDPLDAMELPFGGKSLLGDCRGEFTTEARRAQRIVDRN